MLSERRLRQLRAAPLTRKNKLAEAKRLADLTQIDIAARVGLTQAHISRLERGLYSEMPMETARRFAKLYGCTIEDLFPDLEAVAS